MIPGLMAFIGGMGGVYVHCIEGVGIEDRFVFEVLAV